jgi:hypothetical protein
MSPFQREAGENAWADLTLASSDDGRMLGKLSKIRSQLLDGHGDFSLLLKKLEQTPELRKQLDDILSEGEPASGEGSGRSRQLFERYLSQYEEARKRMETSSEGKSGGPLAGLDIKGVISAITALTSAVNSAAKTP